MMICVWGLVMHERAFMGRVAAWQHTEAIMRMDCTVCMMIFVH